MKTLLGKWKVSGLTLIELLIMLALFAGAYQAAAQDSCFFRISGPAATTIIAFHPDGNLVWSNAQPGATYTIQKAGSFYALPGGTINWADHIQITTINPIHTNKIIDPNPPAGMALIPAGSFTMGNSIGDTDITDANPTNVYVSGFYMDVNLVSYSQWLEVYGYATIHGYIFANTGSGKATNHPVQTVDWFDCVKWCNARSQQTGLMPVYYTDALFTQVYTNGETVNIFANWSANGYRLPTEAEWEKAARGGLSGQRFPWGNTISENQANYNAAPGGLGYDLGPYTGYNTNFNSAYPWAYPFTSPVGVFAPNSYGLYDMTGNVFEWCWDWYADPPYPAGSPYLGGTDPRGSVGLYNYGVVRGGTWSYSANYARCAYRGVVSPGFANNRFGFRCVRGL